MDVTAYVSRSGDWWAVHVPEVPGAFAQVRQFDQVHDAARAAVADLLEVSPASVSVTRELGPPR